jgi:predicted acylesterase/phospholipase RssA
VRILSLDGGGIRGVLTAQLLKRLQHTDPDLVGKCNLIAGTSIGGINALMLAAGKPLDELVSFYTERAKDIFKKRDWLDTMSAGMDELFRSDFAHEDIYGVLTDAFGDLRMGDLDKEVLVPAFDMRTWRPKFYDNSDTDVLVRDVARMTSSAPTYWPTHLWSVDGGLFANNPSDSALVAGLRMLRTPGVPVGKCLTQIKLLSIGTGQVPHQAPSENPAWDAGIKDAIPFLLDVIMDGSVTASSFRTAQLLEERHYRLQTLLPSAIDLKDVNKVFDLITIANLEDLDEVNAWLAIHWT